VRLLGELALHDGARTVVRLPSRAAAALVARLALWPDRAHPREELVELLWPGVDLDAGRNRLRQTLSVLRSVLETDGAGAGPVLVADRQHLRAAPGAFACDVPLFEAALRRGDAAAARAWYRGALMPGFYDEWILEERMRLETLAERVTQGAPFAPVAHVDRHEAAGIEPPARRADPAPGMPALPLYLTPVFGIDLAGARLREAILAHRLVTVVGPGGGGKTRLAVEVARSLAEPGAGGRWQRWQGEVLFVPMGACRTRAELLDRLVMTLRLDPAADEPQALVQQALSGRPMLLVLDNLEQAAGPAAALIAGWLSALPLLRVVATSRQVLGVDGESLLAVDPLALPAADLALDELALNPAVALFVDRARERRSDFHLGATNAAALGELVQLLEGHPLAIELAAARVRSTPPARWVELLREARAQAAFDDGGETLSLLARSGPRAGGDARHASMARVIEGSWALLDERARRMLGAMATFDGGCDAAAAREVGAPEASAAAVQRTLDDLVSSSLLVAHEPPDDARARTAAAGPRFVPYESVREFAAARFTPGERAAWRARHRLWMRRLPRDDGPTPDLARLRDEMPNLLRALANARRDGVPAQAWQLAHAHRGALTDVTLPATGLEALEAAASAVTDPGLRLFADAVLATQAYESGRHAVALAHADAVLARLGSPSALPDAPAWPRDASDADEANEASDAAMPGPGAAASPASEPLGAWAIGWAIRIRMRVGRRIEEHDPWLEAALADARAAGAVGLEARLVGLQASLMMRNRADHPGAEVLRRRALALALASGDRLRANEARIALAICLGFQHRIEAQLPLLAEAEREARALEQPRLVCFALSVRGYCLADLRRHEDALAAFLACLQEAWRALAWRELFYGLWNLTRTLAHRREPERAARLMGFAEAFYAERFGTLGPEDLREARRTRRLCAVQLGREGTARAWAAGGSMAVADAVALALAVAPGGLRGS
jgi:predicted ATPase